MMELRSGRRAQHAEQRLYAREASLDEAKLLKLSPRSHVFQVEWVVYDESNVPFEYFIAALDISRYEFISTIHAETEEVRGRSSVVRSPWST